MRMEIIQTEKKAAFLPSFRHEKNFFNHIEDKLKDLGYEVLDTALNASRSKESKNVLSEGMI